MKKAVFFFLTLVLISSCAFSQSFYDLYKKPADTYRQMTVGGAVGSSGSVSVELITAVEDSQKGVPFDLENGVDYTSGVGRHIADWTLFSNSNSVTIKITAYPLKTTVAGSGEAEIDYTLRFSYSFTTYDENGKPSPEPIIGAFDIPSDSTERSEVIKVDATQKIEINTGNGQIRIMPIKTGESGVESAPPGLYEANVKIIMEGQE